MFLFQSFFESLKKNNNEFVQICASDWTIRAGDYITHALDLMLFLAWDSLKSHRPNEATKSLFNFTLRQIWQEQIFTSKFIFQNERCLLFLCGFVLEPWDTKEISELAAEIRLLSVGMASISRAFS